MTTPSKVTPVIACFNSYDRCFDPDCADDETILRGGMGTPGGSGRCSAEKILCSRKGETRSGSGIRRRSAECPRQESNLGTWFRKPLLYPLSYGGAGAG